MAVAATISFTLSQRGQLDALKRGGSGKRSQSTTWQVEGPDIDMFSADENGTLTLDATYAEDQRKISDLYTIVPATDFFEVDKVEWDVYPDWEDLLDFARHRHAIQQEKAQVWADRQKAIDAEKASLAAAFLADPNQRPEKTGKSDNREYVVLQGKNIFDDAVVAEAKRRLEADQEAVRQDNRRTLAAWLREHGTDNQRQRLAAGLLPWHEASTSVEHFLFEPLSSFPLYERFDANEVCICEEIGLDRCKVKFKSTDATELTAEEWDNYSAIRSAVPEAQFQLRQHEAECVSRVFPEMRRGVIVKMGIGKLTYKREYALTPAPKPEPLTDIDIPF